MSHHYQLTNFYQQEFDALRARLRERHPELYDESGAFRGNPYREADLAFNLRELEAWERLQAACANVKGDENGMVTFQIRTSR